MRRPDGPKVGISIQTASLDRDALAQLVWPSHDSSSSIFARRVDTSRSGKRWVTACGIQPLLTSFFFKLNFIVHAIRHKTTQAIYSDLRP